MSDDIKLIAFHLPQFHECEENNMWWGKGFTEWNNTRQAKPIFYGHNQPREPLNDYYYDLSCKRDILWQMKMAKDYHIYGFCFYHYWFLGKKILNYPIETIRDMKDEKINYCLCWANETWTRTWNGDDTILMKQEYGDQNEWELHFQYLLTFFKDDYYIKRDNSPMLLIYRSMNIPKYSEMIQFWERRCIDYGFSGICIIEEMNSFQNNTFGKTCLQFEPLYTMKYGRTEREFKIYKQMSKIFNSLHRSNNLIYSYSMLWKNILRREIPNGLFLGAFVDWDNTARKGKNGRIVLGTSVRKFEKFLKEQKERAIQNKIEYIFINAWNEWGEGTYLEPDKKNRNKYLEVVKKIF